MHEQKSIAICSTDDNLRDLATSMAKSLDTQLLDDKFVNNLALKTGKDKKETKKLIDLVANLRAQQICTEDDLLKLNRAIEIFYNE